MKHLFARTAALFALVALCSAHVGSPDAWYEGNAGPYRVLINVVMPPVIPGVTTVYARVFESVKGVSIGSNRFDALAASPPPEAAQPVAGDAGLYTGRVWIMTSGSNSIIVNVSGSKGVGRAIVPVVAVPTRRLEFDKRLGALLLAVGVFLVIGAISIIGALIREGVLPPGVEPDAERRKKARFAMSATGALIALLLVGGATWWKSEDSNFSRSIYKPLKSSSKIVTYKNDAALDLSIDDSTWINRNDTAWLNKHRANHWSPLITDHGKLMHVFMVRDPDLGAFAHLHPITSSGVQFIAFLPKLPPGGYRVYGDIVHESGFTETLSSRVTVPSALDVSKTPTDPDDASFIGAASDSGKTLLSDGSVMTLDRRKGPIIAGREANLRFVVTGPDGKPEKLDPYMGMKAHAVITRDDGAVFVHLHPSGTISMASQLAFAMRKPSDSTPGALAGRLAVAERQMTGEGAEDGIVEFPYAFPQPGHYHIWVQVRRGKEILTGAFALSVGAAR
jgi:hypothetical protein